MLTVREVSFRMQDAYIILCSKDRICGFRSRPAWSSTYVIVQRVFCGGNCHLISVTLPYIRNTRSFYPSRRHSSFTDNCLNLPSTMRKLLLGNSSERQPPAAFIDPIYIPRAIAIVRRRVCARVRVFDEASSPAERNSWPRDQYQDVIRVVVKKTSVTAECAARKWFTCRWRLNTTVVFVLREIKTESPYSFLQSFFFTKKTIYQKLNVANWILCTYIWNTNYIVIIF